MKYHSNVGGYILQLLQISMKGLGMWLTPKDRAILKAQRKKFSSKGKSSLPQKLPASFERESVADCCDQTNLESFESGKDPAMANTVEEPSAITRTGACDDSMQRIEARSHRRNYVPVKRGKAHVTLKDHGLSDSGDSSRGKGGTQKFFTVHSQL
ncbi:MAG: hypothetical protein ACTSQZ_01910 [Candidatus Thorarchaeota archaeon]